MKAKIKIFSALLFILVGLVAFVLISNWQYLFYGKASARIYSVDQLQFINWTVLDGERFRSLNDSQIIIGGINSPVSYIELLGTVDRELLEAQIYYTTNYGERFSEENSIRVPITEKRNGFYIQAEFENACDLRLDITDNSGVTVMLGGITLGAAAFHVDLIFMSAWLLILLLISLFFFFPLRSIARIPVYLRGFLKYTYLLENLVRRDITTKYRRSVLGILWSVLNPFLMMLVITAVFQNLFRFNIENFPLYFLTGQLMFNFVSEATTSSLHSITGSASLIRKVYIPKYIFPLEKCVFALINLLFSMIAVVIMFLVLGVKISWTMLLFPIPIIYAFVFSTGLGLILATLNVYFRDIGHLYGVWVTAWMYLTPIIYPMEILPRKVFAIVKINPLYYYVDYFRKVLLYGQIPSFQSNIACGFCAAAFFILGIAVFKKNQDRFILHI